MQSVVYFGYWSMFYYFVKDLRNFLMDTGTFWNLLSCGKPPILKCTTWCGMPWCTVHYALHYVVHNALHSAVQYIMLWFLLTLHSAVHDALHTAVHHTFCDTCLLGSGHVRLCSLLWVFNSLLNWTFFVNNVFIYCVLLSVNYLSLSLSYLSF